MAEGAYLFFVAKEVFWLVAAQAVPVTASLEAYEVTAARPYKVEQCFGAWQVVKQASLR